MRKIYFLCFLTISFNSYAEGVSESQEVKCIGLMAMAEAAMTVRQNGLPLLDALQNNKDMLTNGEATEGEHSLMKMILRDAYSKPKLYTNEYQLEAVNEYSSKYYLACMEAYESL